MHELMDVDEGFEAGLAAIAAGFCGGLDGRPEAVPE
jgi:hypothetical protein